MEFIQIAYCCSIPFLLIIRWLSSSSVIKTTVVNIIATSNLLLVFYAYALGRQFWELLLMAKKAAELYHLDMHGVPQRVDVFLILRLVIIILPIVFFFKKPRQSLVLTLCMLVLLYWDNPFSFWNTYNLLFKIPEWLCLFCAGYALLWLLNKLPYQSPSP